MALTASIEPAARNVRLDYTVPGTGATVTLTRTGPSGVSATVRGWDEHPATAGAVIARDFEAPIGVPLTYTAVARNSGGGVVSTTSTTITIPSAGCDDTWLTDLARSGNTFQTILEQLPELAYPVPASVHDIIGRRDPVVSSDIAHTPGFELSLLTETLEERDTARAILGNGVPVLLRTPPEDGIGNLYFAVLGYAEQRIVTAGTVPDRRFVVQGRQVARPDPVLYVPIGPSTYADVKASFATYADLKTERVNYDAVLYDWPGTAPADVVPWPPDDV